jgi:hypothetical protein
MPPDFRAESRGEPYGRADRQCDPSYDRCMLERRGHRGFGVRSCICERTSCVVLCSRSWAQSACREPRIDVAISPGDSSMSSLRSYVLVLMLCAAFVNSQCLPTWSVGSTSGARPRTFHDDRFRRALESHAAARDMGAFPRNMGAQIDVRSRTSLALLLGFRRRAESDGDVRWVILAYRLLGYVGVGWVDVDAARDQWSGSTSAAWHGLRCRAQSDGDVRWLHGFSFFG